MRDSIIHLLKGVTLIEIENNEEKTIIELSFYDKQHGINSDYPCVNTCIIDDAGEDWFTTTYFSWTDFINEVKAYISYYEAETPQNAEYAYIRECEL